MGKNYDSSNVKNIQNNVSTQAQILEWFGEPFKKGQENGKTMDEVLILRFSGRYDNAWLIFDVEGRLVGYF